MAQLRGRTDAADDLENCLANPQTQGCTVVQTSDAQSGTYETPHPYANNALYMYEVTLPEGGTSITWQLSEFEIDQSDES